VHSAARLVTKLNPAFPYFDHPAGDEREIPERLVGAEGKRLATLAGRRVGCGHDRAVGLDDRAQWHDQSLRNDAATRRGGMLHA